MPVFSSFPENSKECGEKGFDRTKVLDKTAAKMGPFVDGQGFFY